VLQRVTACCSVLQRVAACCSVLQCVACAAVCCIVLQCLADTYILFLYFGVKLLDHFWYITYVNISFVFASYTYNHIHISYTQIYIHTYIFLVSKIFFFLWCELANHVWYSYMFTYYLIHILCMLCHTYLYRVA